MTTDDSKPSCRHPAFRQRTRHHRRLEFYAAVILVFGCVVSARAEHVPEKPAAIIQKYCINCHNSETSEGGIDLHAKQINWASRDDRSLWERVLRASSQHIMPPADEVQPSDTERAVLAMWLDQQLLKHTPIGGTLPRRLNRSEYRATIRSLFNLPEFELPTGFPGDTESHGFTNIGEGLVLSPPLLEAYSNVASQIADELYPPRKPTAKPSVRTAAPEDMVLSFSAATVRDGSLRLASRAVDIMRSCTWLSRIEIADSGTYRVTVSASKFISKHGGSFDDPMILEVYARPVAASERSRVQNFRLLKEIQVASEDPEDSTFEADLYEEETLLFRWKNAEMTHDAPRGGFEKVSRANKRFLAAWLKVVYPNGDSKRPIRLPPLRGRAGWDAVSKFMNDPELDLTGVSTDSELSAAFFKLTQGVKTSIADSLCHYYFEYGPSLEIHNLRIDGPFKLVEGPKDRLRQKQQERFFGVTPGQKKLPPEDVARQMVQNCLPKAFRRPVDDATVDRYLLIAKEHWNAGHRFDEGMHLLVRNILISPRFLYRSSGEGKLDDHDLATRLAYFLTGGPPDHVLVDLANRKRLSPDWVLERESKRLIPTSATSFFVKDFTGQWLDMDRLPEIMPDPKFRFTPYYIDTARSEVEYFFATMLRENRPMTDFIDPDFTYTSPLFAKEIYRLPVPEKLLKDGKVNRRIRRVELDRGDRVGGLLSQSAIMMATANGVDTQPVLRGAWVLENILGTPPPDPPKNVPALTPDTRGTTTPREMLAAHTKNADCAVCHRRIDPFGFVLENFDPVGRWRTTWPKTNKPIDASVDLPDQSRIQDVVELKQWLVANIDQFSQCLAEKLMTYATGRLPNYAEKHEIKKIVLETNENDGGFRDLLLALIASDTFRVK